MPLSANLAVVLAFGAISLAGPRVSAAPQVQLKPSTTKPGVYEKVEFGIEVDAEYRNPFDPEEVDLALRFVTPRGASLTVPAFRYQAYERRQLARGGKTSDWIYPVGVPEWKGRFAPMEPGRYRVVAVLRDRRGAVQSEPVVFEAVASPRKGFLRVGKKDPRYFQRDDGTPVFLIGQNLAFVGDSQYFNLARAEAAFQKLAARGANSLRIWVCCEDWATALEARKSVWGRGWEPKPPIVAMPGEEQNPKARKCLKIPAAGQRPLAVSPTHPLAVRPTTAYLLSGRIRTEPAARVRIAAPGAELKQDTFAGQANAWTEFSLPLTVGREQFFLDRITLMTEGAGSAWLDGLSLREAARGPELLDQADVNRAPRGYYDPLDCFVVDQLVEAADREGIFLQLCYLTRNLYMDSLKDPASDEYRQAVRDARKLTRYAVARWGYATSVGAWEYWNEMDPRLPTDPFYSELGRYLEQIDVFGHLRTTSAWSHSPKDWRHPKLDIAEGHHYLRPASKEGFHDEVDVLLKQVEQLRSAAPQKPAILAEFGLAEDNFQRSPFMKQDENLTHFHNALWASALSGAAGTAHFWWWEQLDQQSAYGHYQPLAAFLADVPFQAGLRAAAATVSGAEVRVVGLESPERVDLWLFNPQATWWNVVVEKQPPATIRAAVLEVSGLASGNYRVQWWDTHTGKIVRQTHAAAAGKTLRLDVPPFSHDLACKVLR